MQIKVHRQAKPLVYLITLFLFTAKNNDASFFKFFKLDNFQQITSKIGIFIYNKNPCFEFFGLPVEDIL
jgi:hypothetical protein